MQDTYKELFSKMKIAGNLAARTLDMITDFIKPGVSTDFLDRTCYEYIRDLSLIHISEPTRPY